MSILAQVVICAIIFAMGAAGGWKAHVGIIAARDLAAAQAQEREVLRKAEKIDTSAAKHEAAKVQIEQQIVEVEKEVVRVVKEPFYVDAPACLNDDGLRLVSEAIHGSDAPSQPASALRKP